MSTVYKALSTFRAGIITIILLGSLFCMPVVALAEQSTVAEQPAVPISISSDGATPNPTIDAPPPPTTTTPPATDSSTNVQVSTSSSQVAASGDIAVSTNDNVSSISTGDATNTDKITNVANVYQNISGNVPSSYTTTLNDSTVGSITIDPQLFTSSNSATPQTNIAITNQPSTIAIDVSLQSTVDQTSNSGTVVAKNNDTVGVASTGSARNSAEIVNISNTIISAGSFFVGMITVFGDLQGDISIPVSALQSLTAPQQTTDSTPSVTLSQQSTTNTAADMSAKSGDALVTNNDTVGDVSTGDASNDIVIKNYAGAHVYTQNTLLIIVTVGGNWNGKILGIPNASVLSISGVNTSQDSSVSTPGSIAVTINSSIQNNLHMSAKSGDALVTNNDTVGDVSTGDASNTARIVNISNAVVSLSKWFGVLYITILGNWYGSVTTYDDSSSTGVPSQTSPIDPPAPNSIEEKRSQQLFGAFSPTQQSTSVTNVFAAHASEPTQSVFKVAKLTDDGSSSFRWLVILGLLTLGVASANRVYQYRTIR